jgi:hypothetical protein
MKRAAAIAAALLIAAGATAQEAPPDVPAGDARVSGRVVHEERPAAAADSLVILYSLTPAGEPGLRQTRAGADGAFAFEGVSGDPAMVYLVGARVEGVPFGARVTFAEGEREARVDIRVSDPSRAAADVALLPGEIHLERGCTHLRVRHRQPLRNPTDRVVYLPPDAREGTAPVLELLLPEGASEVELLTGGAPESLAREGRRLRFFGPVYPGESTLEFGYGVPLSAAAELRLGFPAGSAPLRVFSLKGGTRVTGEGLREEADAVLPAGLHRALRSARVAPGGELRLALALADARESEAVALAEARIWLELDDAVLDVSEEYQLRVEGTAPLEASGDAPLLCVELPPGAEDLRFATPSLDMGLTRDPQGALAVHGPIPAGESSLALRYQLPSAPGPVRFERRVGRDVPLFTLLVADTGLVPSADRLHRRRPFRTEDRSYLHLEAFGIAAGETVAVDLRPLPQRRGLPALASPGFALAAGLAALAFLIAPLRGRGDSAGTGEALPSASAEREAVYQAIEALDEDFETGKLSEADHERMRRELRAQAVALLRREREAAPTPAAAPAACPGCGAAIAAEDRFCAQCGVRLPEQPRVRLPEQPRVGLPEQPSR